MGGTGKTKKTVGGEASNGNERNVRVECTNGVFTVNFDILKYCKTVDKLDEYHRTNGFDPISEIQIPVSAECFEIVLNFLHAKYVLKDITKMESAAKLSDGRTGKPEHDRQAIELFRAANFLQI